MYAVECVIECDKSDGTKCQVGEIIMGADAWILCMNGFRNEKPRFVPADEETAQRVSDETAKRQPIVDQTKRDLQRRIDAYAETGRFTIDPETEFFKRDAQGMLVGKMSKLELHVMETADGYGLKPTPPKAAATRTGDGGKPAPGSKAKTTTTAA